MTTLPTSTLLSVWTKTIWILAGVFCLLTGCSDEITVTINPSAEVANSRQSAATDTIRIDIPEKWQVSNADRPKLLVVGNWTSFSMNRSENGVRLGSLTFIKQVKLPDWTKDSNVSKKSTTRHDVVTYQIDQIISPSGDDTPGSWSLKAVIEEHGEIWEMYVGFNFPVYPQLGDAIGYIDALRIKGSK